MVVYVGESNDPFEFARTGRNPIGSRWSLNLDVLLYEVNTLCTSNFLTHKTQLLKSNRQCNRRCLTPTSKKKQHTASTGKLKDHEASDQSWLIGRMIITFYDSRTVKKPHVYTLIIIIIFPNDYQYKTMSEMKCQQIDSIRSIRRVNSFLTYTFFFFARRQSRMIDKHPKLWRPKYL